MSFIPSCGCINTTEWLHYLKSNEMYREKARWELHKNAMYCLEQILEATLNKTAAVWPLTSHFTKHSSKMNKTPCVPLENDELIGSVLLWTAIHGCRVQRTSQE